MALLKNVPGEYSWITYIKHRIKNKKNFLCLVSGETGSGKSWACLSVALMLDPTFNKERIIFGLKPLLQMINSGEDFKPGTVFLWDEFQIDGSSRNWQSIANKTLNSLLSTFRHKHFILLINAPYSDFIDSQSRKLLHSEWTTKKINYTTKKTHLKPFHLQYNSRRKKEFMKYLRIKTKLGISPLKDWAIPRPPKWIIDDYELMKTAFTNALNKKLEEDINRLEGIQIKKDERKKLTVRQQEIFDLMNKYQDVSIVAEKAGLSKRNTFFNLQQARKKGYSIEKGGI